MNRPRHFRNHGESGDTVFLTTTCLDFAQLLARAEMANAMVEQILAFAERDDVVVHAYVVMSHHIHVLIRLPDGMACSRWVQSFKSGSARILRPCLLPSEVAQLQMQTGLDGRQFWMRSYRSFVVRTDTVFRQKVAYIHQNPVRAGLVEFAEEYPHSSARLWADDRWGRDDGLDL